MISSSNPVQTEDYVEVPCEYCGQPLLMKKYNNHACLHQREQRFIFPEPMFLSMPSNSFGQTNVR